MWIMAKRNLNHNGQVLIMGYLVVAALLLLAGALVNKITNESLIVDRQRLEGEVFYLAEGGIEDAISKFLYGIANFQISTNPLPSQYPATGTVSSNYTPSTAFPAGATVTSVINEAEYGMRTITDPDGSQIFVKNYIVSSSCTHPLNNGITITLHQSFTLRLIYAFQHAVFYNDDLEILSGPNMNFTGRIHGNKDIYLNSRSTLKIDSEYLHSAGNIYNKRKDDPGDSMGGEVDIKKSGTGAFFEMDGLDSDSSDWQAESQSRWNGTVKSSVHGVTKLTTPAVGSIQPGGYYASQANIIIENEAITQGGLVLTEGVDIPIGTVTIDSDFYNNREGKNVRMTNVDLKKLAGYATADPEGNPGFPNHLPSNGLLYVTRNTFGVNEQPGVRLINGVKIYRNSGLTVVSNDPIYIQGDYNNINKKPASVICDAVNILSNGWDDVNSAQGLGSRLASATTVNTAFIAGVDNTSTGHYNGGLENYPRLHEKWSGNELKIRGAFIELWNSQIAQGGWIYGSPQYEAPNRNWDYDTSFSSSNMPPFTPWAVEARKGAWWK